MTRAAALLCRLISTGAGGMRAAAMDLAALSMFDTAASSPVDGDGQSRVCALAVAMVLAAECRLESGSVLCRWRLTEPGRKARSRDADGGAAVFVAAGKQRAPSMGMDRAGQNACE